MCKCGVARSALRLSTRILSKPSSREAGHQSDVSRTQNGAPALSNAFLYHGSCSSSSAEFEIKNKGPRFTGNLIPCILFFTLKITIIPAPGAVFANQKGTLKYSRGKVLAASKKTWSFGFKFSENDKFKIYKCRVCEVEAGGGSGGRVMKNHLNDIIW